MNYENHAKLASEAAERLSTELQTIMRKPNWGGPDIKLLGDMLCNLKEALCIAQMAEGGNQGNMMMGGEYSGNYSGRRGYSHAMGRSQANGYSSMGNSGNSYSGEGSYANSDGGYAGYSNGYSGHSIDDRVLAVLEEMAGRAGSDYERSRIKEKIDTLRRM